MGSRIVEHPLASFALRRLVSLVAVLVGLVVATFMMIRLIPGDPAVNHTQDAPPRSTHHRTVPGLRSQLGAGQSWPFLLHATARVASPRAADRCIAPTRRRGAGGSHACERSARHFHGSLHPRTPAPGRRSRIYCWSERTRLTARIPGRHVPRLHLRGLAAMASRCWSRQRPGARVACASRQHPPDGNPDPDCSSAPRAANACLRALFMPATPYQTL